jgi:Domain of unknown function (DUF4253)
MEFTTLKVPGTDALRLLNEHRARYPATGKYPFLIGDDYDLRNVKDRAESSRRNPAAIIRASLGITIAEWIVGRRQEAEEGESALDETAGIGRGEIEATLSDWPGEILEKGSIGLHKDVSSGKIKPQVYLGLAKIDKPWHLPAVLKYGGWNECPGPEVHCAFHREWQERFGAEITGMSGDVVECTVKNPPTDPKAATILAWEQAWYCADIVAQGCDTVSNLAATLINSPYWYFWWD